MSSRSRRSYNCAVCIRLKSSVMRFSFVPRDRHSNAISARQTHRSWFVSRYANDLLFLIAWILEPAASEGPKSPVRDAETMSANPSSCAFTVPVPGASVCSSRHRAAVFRCTASDGGDGLIPFPPSTQTAALPKAPPCCTAIATRQRIALCSRTRSIHAPHRGHSEADRRAQGRCCC